MRRGRAQLAPARSCYHRGRAADEVETFARCVSVDGVALFPADTVYGLAPEPGIERRSTAEGPPPAATALDAPNQRQDHTPVRDMSPTLKPSVDAQSRSVAAGRWRHALSTSSVAPGRPTRPL
jgi:hypothetical protein